MADQDAPKFCWWMTAARAKALGCTHHGRFAGIVPGFVRPDDVCPLWVSRSDLLNPIEDLVALLWVATRRWRGEEPDWSIWVGKEIGISIGGGHDG